MCSTHMVLLYVFFLYFLWRDRVLMFVCFIIRKMLKGISVLSDHTMSSSFHFLSVPFFLLTTIHLTSMYVSKEAIEEVPATLSCTCVCGAYRT